MSNEEHRRYNEYKQQLSISVDESAPHFAVWMRLFLAIMAEAESSVEVQVEERYWDCCVVSSKQSDDLRIAHTFCQMLSKNGFIGCVLHDTVPGRDCFDAARDKMEGSVAIFVLCTPGLLKRGLHTIAYKEQLVSYLTNRGIEGKKKICPLVLPNVAEKTLALADQPITVAGGSPILGPTITAAVKWQYSTAAQPQTVIPFGLGIFQSIVFNNEAQVIKQMERVVNAQERGWVRRQREADACRRALQQEQLVREAVQRAKDQALNFFHIRDPLALMQITRSLNDTRTSPVVLGAQSNNHASSGLDRGLGAIAGNSQTVHVNHSNNVTVGPSYHWTVSDTSYI